MNVIAALKDTCRAGTRSVAVFTGDVGRGLHELANNTFALVGLVVTAALLFAASRADLRHEIEVSALGWLQARQEARAEATGDLLPKLAESHAVARATAADPKDLTKEQRIVASWIARRYHVAPEPVSRLVQEAWSVGKRANVDPTLILAIMAVESSFNPFAQSTVGAQGLMQVMTKVHDDKYEAFGGVHAAFDPLSNLRVGVQVLKDCIARAGSVEGGLRCYVGAALLESDGGYAAKVRVEQRHLQRVAKGQQVAVTVSSKPSAVAVEATRTTPAV